MIHILTFTTDWIIGITGVIGVVISILVGLPILSKYFDNKKYKKTKKILEDKKRQVEVQPNFEIISSELKSIIKFRNTGAKATKFIFTVANTKNVMLIPNKQEAETFEVVSLYLGDKFNETENSFLQVHFGYADIDNRTYQQTYIRKPNLEKITQPELLSSPS